MKKLLTLAALGALFASALPAGAASVTKTGTVTVKWNTSVTANLVLATNYDAAGAQQLTAPAILPNANPGAGSCTANGTGSEVAATANFGPVSPDFTNPTGCLYKNAVNAVVQTNSLNWTLSEALSAAVAGATLCAYANGNGGTFPATISGAAAATTTARATSPVGATCGAGAATLPSAAPPGLQVASSTTSYPTGANIGEDLELILSPATPSGAQSYTVTYTLVAN
ncbi:MAG: hypothetical protein M3R35_07410 [Candidatus Eremiobacteraeota bacterium]|nr:hypothetical protein [Candidatus Eremiobacteraeota bacterium]